jgi:tRNA uridine 5-carbamoylmethylation protein Kti12
MFGLPGSGKSTKVQELCKNLLVGQDIYIYSTDDYWLRPDGYYDWNPARIKEAHQWNFNRFNQCMINAIHGWEAEKVIVDNTNLRFEDVKRYIDKAKDAGYTVSLVEPETPWRYNPAECAKRNIHRVPLDKIELMYKTLVENKPKILSYING